MLLFDPFKDRKARNIRNEMSEAFSRSLDEMSPSYFRKTAQNLLQHFSADIYSEYIRQRLRQYESTFDKIFKKQVNDPLLQAIDLWNAGLFFECHDRLEPVWQNSTGDKRKALKGFIQAAGAYVHLENKNNKAALSLGKKAARLIYKHGRALQAITNRQELIERLDPLSPNPPRISVTRKINN